MDNVTYQEFAEARKATEIALLQWKQADHRDTQMEDRLWNRYCRRRDALDALYGSYALYDSSHADDDWKADLT